MTAKKAGSEKVPREVANAKRSVGQARALARKRAVVATYTDDKTGEHYIGGFKVSNATWAAFLVEHPEYGPETETVGSEQVVAVPDLAEAAAVEVPERTDPPVHDPNAHGAQTFRHHHPHLGRAADPGLWHSHVNGAYTHTHDNGDGLPVYGEEVLPPPQDFFPQEKSEEQKDSEHAAALAAAQESDREAKVTFPEIGDTEADLVFHVLVDGFTALGKVWYRAEEIKLQKGSPTWDLTVDRKGHSWTEMGDQEQMLRYGNVMFRPGPWPYKKQEFTEEDYEKALSEGDFEAIERYEKMQQRQGIPTVTAGSSKAGRRKW